MRPIWNHLRHDGRSHRGLESWIDFLYNWRTHITEGEVSGWKRGLIYTIGERFSYIPPQWICSCWMQLERHGQGLRWRLYENYAPFSAYFTLRDVHRPIIRKVYISTHHPPTIFNFSEIFTATASLSDFNFEMYGASHDSQDHHNDKRTLIISWRWVKHFLIWHQVGDKVNKYVNKNNLF